MGISFIWKYIIHIKYVVTIRLSFCIIPDKAVCRVEARAPEKNMLDELTEGVFRCARARL